jgi:hypothetical protein
MLEGFPATGKKLLSNIPRFEQVAEMIGRQREENQDCVHGDPVQVGAGMLKVALEVDRMVANGIKVKDAAQQLLKAPCGCDPRLLEILRGFELSARPSVLRAVTVRDLSSFMVLEEDVYTQDGKLIVAKGRKVSLALMEQLRNFAGGVGVKEPIRVSIRS